MRIALRQCDKVFVEGPHAVQHAIYTHKQKYEDNFMCAKKMVFPALFKLILFYSFPV